MLGSDSLSSALTQRQGLYIMTLGTLECALVVWGRAVPTTGPSFPSSHSIHILSTCPSSYCPGDPETPAPHDTWRQHYDLALERLP